MRNLQNTSELMVLGSMANWFFGVHPTHLPDPVGFKIFILRKPMAL